MTTEPTTVTEPRTALTTEDTGHSISAFASEAHFQSALRMANALSKSSLVPEAYRNNIPNILIAMEQAHRIGASVFAVMQNLDIIHGRPSWRSTFLIATVNACGRFTPLRFRFVGVEGTDTWGCRAVAKDVASGEECIGTLITMGLADAEGWAKKNGSKWKTMPEQMLCYRAAAFWTRVYAPELSLGMTSDEAQDVHGAIEVAPTLPAGLVPGNTRALEEELMREPPKEPAPVSSETGHIPPSDVA